ncbi:MAG: ABC transporter permease [Planctomycetota bacterium]
MKHVSPVSSWREGVLTVIAVASVAVIAIACWYAIIWIFGLPKILLPTPGDVLNAGWVYRQDLVAGTFTTAMTAVVSLAVAMLVGSGIAIVFSQSKLLRRALFPYVVFLQTVPIVAIAPLLIIWSGYEFRTAIIATVIICLFPIINNVTTGLSSARVEQQDLFRLYGASRGQRLLRLQIPSAIPYLVLGTRISSGLAVIGAIVAEFFVSNGADYEGLGALMTGWQARTMTDALMAALAMSTLLGLTLFGFVDLLAKRLLKRYLVPQ